MPEEWKPLFISSYLVSNYGNILNVNTGNIKYSYIHKDGYRRVALYSKGKARQFYVHRLVAFSFLGFDINSDLIVHHKDHNRLNNRIDNLEILTREENSGLKYPPTHIQHIEDIIRMYNSGFSVEEIYTKINSNLH